MRRRTPRSVLALSLLFAGGLLAACGSSDSPDPDAAPATTTIATNPGDPVVVVKDFEFGPDAIEIHPGQTVTWRFQAGTMPHNVVGDDGLKSPLKRKGIYTHRFDRPGTYRYRCTVHPQMKGSVVVA